MIKTTASYTEALDGNKVCTISPTHTLTSTSLAKQLELSTISLYLMPTLLFNAYKHYFSN